MTRKPIICIDAGHGGKDSGAVGPGGLREKDVALSVALLMGSMLLGDCEVTYTRRDDRFIELGNRAMIANDLQADALISIHCNSGPAGSGDGFEVFTSPGQTDSDKLATAMFLAFATEFPDKRKRVDLADGDPDKEAKFTVLTKSHMRSVLFELEFIHTVAGEQWLKSPLNQARCAQVLAAGVLYHFGLRKATSAIVQPVGSPAAPADELMAGFDRLESRLSGALGNYRKELETIFRQP